MLNSSQSPLKQEQNLTSWALHSRNLSIQICQASWLSLDTWGEGDEDSTGYLYSGDVPPNPIVIFDQYLERTKGQFISANVIYNKVYYFERKIALKRGLNLEDRTAQTHPKSTGILRGDDYHFATSNLVTSVFHYNMN